MSLRKFCEVFFWLLNNISSLKVHPYNEGSISKAQTSSIEKLYGSEKKAKAEEAKKREKKKRKKGKYLIILKPRQAISV